MKRAAWALVAGAVVLARLAPGRASASPEFPPVIESHLSLSYVPKCTICHATNDADAGPADTPFAASAVARGLKADDDDSLRAALDAMARDRVDGDRMRDIDELTWGSTERAPRASGDVAPPVTYGCSAAASHGRRRRGAAVGVVAAICTLVRTRFVVRIFAVAGNLRPQTVCFAHFAAILFGWRYPSQLLATFVR
jgi:hypothetical protein